MPSLPGRVAAILSQLPWMWTWGVLTGAYAALMVTADVESVELATRAGRIVGGCGLTICLFYAFKPTGMYPMIPALLNIAIGLLLASVLFFATRAASALL